MKFKQDKVQFIAELYIVCVCVCVCVSAGGVGDVIQAGLVLQQDYIPGKHHTNLTQNSHFKQCFFVGVRGFTTSSYILYDYL